MANQIISLFSGAFRLLALPRPLSLANHRSLAKTGKSKPSALLLAKFHIRYRDGSYVTPR
jgi:hypothetical protein